MLTSAELDSVVAHELGHRKGRHGAVLIPLQAIASFVPFLPIARFAPTSMRAYLEMTADDFSRARGGTDALRSALAKAQWFTPAPAGSLSAFDDVIGRRLHRLSRAYASRSDSSTVLVTTALSIVGLWFIVGFR
jgi:Zn-dependent protease with chaperone function